MTIGIDDDFDPEGLYEGPQRRREPRREPEGEDDPDGIPCVSWVPIRCPRCGSKKKSSDNVQRLVRFHTCLDCEQRFKSYERKG